MKAIGEDERTEELLHTKITVFWSSLLQDERDGHLLGWIEKVIRQIEGGQIYSQLLVMTAEWDLQIQRQQWCCFEVPIFIYKVASSSTSNPPPVCV